MPTKIEWTHVPGYKGETWNPVTGCTKVSPGCAHCYAERIDARFKRGAGPYLPGLATITCHTDRLGHPLRWASPRAVFVCSMSDLFHDEVPDEFIEAVFGIMAVASTHIFMVLTKRPERALRWFTERGGLETREQLVARAAEERGLVVWDSSGSDRAKYALVRLRLTDAQLERRRVWPGWPLPNVWVGTSVENQHWADVRIPELVQIPAAVRFLSVEPLLKPVDLSRYLVCCPACDQSHLGYCEDRKPAPISWVIVGGESGPRARPMPVEAARQVRDQAVNAGVPFFFKQWGEWAPRVAIPTLFGDWNCKDAKASVLRNTDGSGTIMVHVGRKAAGTALDGREWLEFPPVPVTHKDNGGRRRRRTRGQGRVIAYRD